VANRPDEGLLQTAQFPHIFSPQISLTHHLRLSPLSQLGEGFQCIDLIYKFDLYVEKQPVRLLPSPEGEGG